MKLVVMLLVAATLLSAQTELRPILLDGCEESAPWETFHSAGVEISRHRDVGLRGNSLRFDVTFTKGTGYGGVVRKFDLPLADDFELTFWMRATVPMNNFEVKISDDSLGQDIWWANMKNYVYPAEWERIKIKRRHITFAWGPHPAAMAKKLRRLELVVTAGTGGSGRVWIDSLELTPLPPPPAKLPTATVSASSSLGKAGAAVNALPGRKGGWVSKTSGREWIDVDFKYRRDLGGVQLSWDPAMKGLTYSVLGSTDGKSYDTLHTVHEGKGGKVLIFTPEAEVQYLRIALEGNQSHERYRLEEISAVSGESLSTRNQYIEHLASTAPRGFYPRYFLHEASYWTIVGVSSDPREALFNEDGVFEVDKQSFSVEPLVKVMGRDGLLTWANGKCEQSLERGYIPIPSVRRSYDDFALTVTLLANGEAGRSALLARYSLRNTSGRQRRGTLFITVRPFQVNPTYQWLNFEGGVARIDSIELRRNRAVVGDKSITLSGEPSWAGTSTIDRGDIDERISAGDIPSTLRVFDGGGLASGAFGYDFDLRPGDSTIVIAAVPFTREADRWERVAPTPAEFEQALSQGRSSWSKALDRVQLTLPPEAHVYADILRSNLAYILINKDGPGFQPGSRSYERSWIRDGSMTSAALLKLGLTDEVKKFVEWYSSYQYENGMVPCVVDHRGADPVPENDSHGELIFSCMEYFRFTRDTTFLRARWRTIVSAAEYIQQLRGQRMTPEYLSGNEEKRACYGLVPESISHEGYSAKPMHSYWDDFFALKGLKDAAAAARVLGEVGAARRYDSLSTSFRSDINNSISLAMKNKRIEYIPGCVELGDFDATSTSIALFPCGEQSRLPQIALGRTFNKYYEWFQKRAGGNLPWEAFTPYEVRNVGTFVYLGEKARAHALLDWFLKYQRPPGWNQWAEVVWHGERQAKFIGDMPHTWVGSDFINAFRAMFVYEGDDEPSVVIGAGLKDEWVVHGLSVEGLPTHFGTISYSTSSPAASTVAVNVEGSVDAAKSPVLIPVGLLTRPLLSATVNGSVTAASGGFVKVSQLPAIVELKY